MGSQSFEAAHERTVNEQGSGSVQMDNGARGVNSQGEVIDNSVVEQELEALERKKKWYSYLTTKDFWIVLAIGYVESFSRDEIQLTL